MVQRRIEVTNINLGEELDFPVVTDLRTVHLGRLSAHWLNYRQAGDQASRSALVFASVKEYNDEHDQSQEPKEEWPIPQILTQEERAMLVGAPLVLEALGETDTVTYGGELTRDDAYWLVKQFENGQLTDNAVA